MKQQVKLSWGVLAWSVFIIAVFVGLAYYYYTRDRMWLCGVLLVCEIVWLLATLFYMPCSIEIEGKDLSINRPLWCKRIPLSQVRAVRLYNPTMGERRIFGSGGFMGYWGWFRNPEIGKYFAYYGRSSDCFLILLRDGRRYMLGCANPAAMVEAIQERIS